MKPQHHIAELPMVIVLIGPMGCGKTTIGRLLAKNTGRRFVDADDYHPAKNIEKMSAGNPLNDHDRKPWLLRLARLIEDAKTNREPLVLACSALKDSYRETLGIDQKLVISVYLKGDPNLLIERVGCRNHQYMNKGLLDSQLATMEEPAGGLVVDISQAPENIVSTIITAIGG